MIKLMLRTLADTFIFSIIFIIDLYGAFAVYFDGDVIIPYALLLIGLAIIELILTSVITLIAMAKGFNSEKSRMLVYKYVYYFGASQYMISFINMTVIGLLAVASGGSDIGGFQRMQSVWYVYLADIVQLIIGIRLALQGLRNMPKSHRPSED